MRLAANSHQRPNQRRQCLRATQLIVLRPFWRRLPVQRHVQSRPKPLPQWFLYADSKTMTTAVLPHRMCRVLRSIGKLPWHKYVQGGIGPEVSISRRALAKVHLAVQREDLVEEYVSLVRQEGFEATSYPSRLVSTSWHQDVGHIRSVTSLSLSSIS